MYLSAWENIWMVWMVEQRECQVIKLFWGQPVTLSIPVAFIFPFFFSVRMSCEALTCKGISGLQGAGQREEAYHKPVYIRTWYRHFGPTLFSMWFISPKSDWHVLLCVNPHAGHRWCKEERDQILTTGYSEERVRETEKPSYDKMIREISWLAGRGGGEMWTLRLHEGSWKASPSTSEMHFKKDSEVCGEVMVENAFQKREKQERHWGVEGVLEATDPLICVSFCLWGWEGKKRLERKTEPRWCQGSHSRWRSLHISAHNEEPGKDWSLGSYVGSSIADKLQWGTTKGLSRFKATTTLQARKQPPKVLLLTKPEWTEANSLLCDRLWFLSWDSGMVLHIHAGYIGR